MDESTRIQRMKFPDHPVDVVMDTDTFNEIDDQFALAYMLKSQDKLNVKAINAAPFFNGHSTSPEDGMLRSYDEILHVLKLLGMEQFNDFVYQGSTTFLTDEKTPVESPAARNLVKLAHQQDVEKPLYIIALAAITNIASALLLDPSIREKIVVVWLGGNSYTWPNNKEFNLFQDIAAARVVFDSGVPVIQLPCMGVVSELRTTGPELRFHLKDGNAFCDYLIDITYKEAQLNNQGDCWSRAIWDVAAVAWLLDEKFELSRLEASPICQYDNHYSFDHCRPLIQYVYWVDRDRIFADLFTKLSK